MYGSATALCTMTAPRFARSFTLPNTVDSENVEADYDSGVLKITLPKREEAKPKQIKVAVGAKTIEAGKRQQAA